MDFKGFMGERLKANLENWLLQVPSSNPAMLQMIRDRDRQPRAVLVPWYGEFPGKFVTSAALEYKISKDERLFKEVNNIVDELGKVQDMDGYLGPHPRNERLTECLNPEMGWGTDVKLWDVWGHYHCMLGLLMWYNETGGGLTIHQWMALERLQVMKLFFRRIKGVLSSTAAR